MTGSMTYYAYLESPLGPLLAASTGGMLTHLYLPKPDGPSRPEDGWRPSDEPFGEVRRQLEAYFAGTRQQFDLPLGAQGTPFQQRVWQELVKIPCGETISYGELARRIGQPTASRAVGAANGRNPISIIVPCHRVIGTSGKLVGYGGGLDNKRWLLDFERRQRPAAYGELFAAADSA